VIDGGLRRLFRARLPGDWSSVETGMSEPGVPDSNFCIGGVEGWVEYKLVSGWAIRRTRTLPAQVGWHLRRARNGGRTFVAVRRAPSSADELWLFPGAQFRLLAAGGLRGGADVLYRGIGGPARWDWREVKKVLTARRK